MPTSALERAPCSCPVLAKPVDVDALWAFLHKVRACAKSASQRSSQRPGVARVI
jgi:hypothetical protein